MSDQFATPTLVDPSPVTGAKVYCVRVCMEDPEDDAVHIFSTAEKAKAYAEADPSQRHVLYDYVIDCPERMEGRTQ